MKTASITGSISRNAGGLFESVRRLHQSLAELGGIEVAVLGLQDKLTTEDLHNWAPLIPEAFSMIGPWQFGYSPTLSTRLGHSDVEILHTHGIWQFPSAAVLAWHKKTSKPYMVSPHGMLDCWAVRNSNWKKQIALALYERQHLQNAACIRALCEAEANAIRNFGLENPICIIPNGVDLPDQPNVMATPPSPLWKGAIENDKNILLYLGRLHPKKGIINLLKGWNHQRKLKCSSHGKWSLAIAGWGQNGHELELKRLATELQIPWSDIRDFNATPGVTARNQHLELLFLGPQFGEHKAACYRNCDAFILPSLSEGLPMVVLEAWAFSKPVLMTSQCNLPEGLSANAALSVTPTVEGIAEGLGCLFTTPDAELRAMGARGRKLIYERFDWPSIAQALKDVYEWVLGSGPKPSCVFD